MVSQSYFTYDPAIIEGSNITGVYTSVHFMKTKNYIPVTAIEVERYRKRPNSFRIEDGKLIEVVKNVEHVKLSELSKPRSQARSQILRPIEVDNRVYEIDLPFQTNLALALCLSTHMDDQKPKFWCKENGDWVFRQHTLDELVAISAEINKRREEISSRLYDELG